MHRVAVSKNMRHHRHAKMYPFAVGLALGFREPVAHRTIGRLPNRQGGTFTRLCINLKLFFGTGEQPTQLVDNVRIGQRYQPIGDFPVVGRPGPPRCCLGVFGSQGKKSRINAIMAPMKEYCCDKWIIAMSSYLANPGILYILAFSHVNCTINMNK